MVKPSTVRDVLLDVQDRFCAADLDTPELDARLLLQAATGLRHEDLILEAALSVTDEERGRLEAMVARRLKHEPVSRILGSRAFWNADFRVTPDTLDPRADSETLVEGVLGLADKTRPLTILDLGTGTGCLLLSLLQELPLATGLGIDISAGAVEAARGNAESLGLTSRSYFMKIDWKKLTPLTLHDIVISNPPYITAAEMEALAPEVREYDPIAALSGGADGLDCYREIAALLPRALAPHGLLILEIGAAQAESVKGILGRGGLAVLQTLTDLAGQDRCIIARWAKA
ncbi:MAG: peptide chain release factor N(5)-glutamine methyltransferase [Alphaproteobacteria bacterium]|nr:peptide chain release factor N(5)-glutamine methyltransferase [Alphaproteobacteria bacterium]MDE2335852.1 peptide chain release factor N(5)-glutamine methyltransferase [Alphaproteobacteria bacterium]